MLPIGMLLWAERAYHGIDLGLYAKQSVDRLVRQFEVLDATLEQWRWLDDMGSRPVTVADSLLWDQLRNVCDLFGGTGCFELGRFATLQRFFDDYPASDAFRGFSAATPCQVTGMPDEAAAVEKVRGLLRGTVDSP
jgi:hypothetical protein